MKATLDDVAHASGVSKAAASYVLNNKKSSFGISPQTVRRVLEESVRLKYRPDAVAVALAGLKSEPLSIQILSPWLQSQFSDFMFQAEQAIQSFSRERKLHVDYQLYTAGRLQKSLKPVKCGKYDAVFVLGTSIEDDDFLDKSKGLFRNLILLNRFRDGYPCSCGNDEEACMKMARRLLAGNYYRKYVFTVNAKTSHREQLRISGYRKAFSGLGSDKYEEFSCSGDEQSFSKHLLDRFGTSRVCFIFTQYCQAARLLNMANRSGVRIPLDIGIAGFDQHSLLRDFLTPSLTTIDPKVYAMTRTSLEMALEMKAGKTPESQVTPAEIIEGGSAVLG